MNPVCRCCPAQRHASPGPALKSSGAAETSEHSLCQSPGTCCPRRQSPWTLPRPLLLASPSPQPWGTSGLRHMNTCRQQEQSSQMMVASHTSCTEQRPTLTKPLSCRPGVGTTFPVSRGSDLRSPGDYALGHDAVERGARCARAESWGAALVSSLCQARASPVTGRRHCLCQHFNA